MTSKFLQDTDTALTDFAQKIDILFQNRFCRNILDSAVEIMQKDLHDMMVISDTENESSSVDNVSSAALPRCMISKCTSVISLQSTSSSICSICSF